jgi:Holliday junction DNA helicase RuvB
MDALALEGIDECGLSELDRKLLKVIMLNYRGGPAGIEALAATLQLESDVLLEVVEPYLLKTGFLIRTSQGRKASEKAFAHLGIANQTGRDNRNVGLFEDKE